MILDTNVVLRLLLGDGHEGLATGAVRLFASAADGRRRLHVSTLVVGECVFVLTGRKNVPRKVVAAEMLSLLRRPGVRCQDNAIVQRALELWPQRQGLHFVDCFLIASAEATGRAVATFDGGIRRSKLVPAVDEASA